MDTFDILLCLSLLIFTFYSFLSLKKSCVTLHWYSCINAIPYFMVTPLDFLHDATYKLPWDDSYNKAHLTGIPTYAYLLRKWIIY